MELQSQNINWFPGHMAKAERMIKENLSLCDAAAEIIDARIPKSSRNPDIDELVGDKPRLVIMNRADLADSDITALWNKHFESKGIKVIETDAKSGSGVSSFVPAVREKQGSEEKSCRDRRQARAHQGEAVDQYRQVT